VDVVGDGEFGVLGALVAGAAVDALVVAAVGDGDAQIGDGAAEGVAQTRAGDCRRTLFQQRDGGSIERRWEQGNDNGFSNNELDDSREFQEANGSRLVAAFLTRTALNSV
jgi:outer membrane lipoprotein SlyB